MSRLEEILQKYEDKNEMHFFQIDKETIIYPAVREYVKECIKASLEKASESGCDSLELYNSEYEKLKESITNPENIVIL